MTRSSITAFILLVHFANATAQDDILVNYNPSGNLALGKGIDINNPGASKPDAFTYSSTKWLDGGSPNTALKASLVTSSNEIYEKLNLSYNFQGSVKIPVYGSGSAQLDTRYELMKEYDDNNLYYLIQGYNDFGREEMQSPVVQPQYQAMLDQNRHKDFIRAVGTHYVVRQRRASQVFALITIKKLNSITKRSLNIKYNSEMSFNIAKVADVTAKEAITFENFMKTAYKYGAVTIEYYSSGTGGLSKLGQGFPQSADDLKSIMKAIAEATESVNKENSTPAEYHLASFEPYGLQFPTPDLQKNECLSRIMDKRAVLNAYITKARKVVLNQPTAQFRPYYDQKIRSMEDRLQLLKTIEKRCREQGVCCAEQPDSDSIYWLEEMINIEKLTVVADYIPIYRDNGQKAGSVIKSLRLVAEGEIMNNEYYCCMDAYYLNVSLDPVKTDLQVVGGINPALSDVEENGHFKKRQFLYVIDNLNIDYQYGPGNILLYTTVNMDKLNGAIESLKRRGYFIEVTSKDNLRNYVDLGAFDFNDLQPFKSE